MLTDRAGERGIAQGLPRTSGEIRTGRRVNVAPALWASRASVPENQERLKSPVTEPRTDQPNDATLRGAQLPCALRAIPDPPARLFCRGDAALLHAPAVAIVGSRRCTRQGRDIAFRLAQDLAAQGLCVVSGLAYGIDAAAHQGVLQGAEADGRPGTTVDVLGGGLANRDPRGHAVLAARIGAHAGALVTEYRPAETPRKHHFPARNRIISGMCLGVVIIEASDKSGSLITARMALEQGRDVMAVPSLVSSPLSAGCHRLIREGAALVERAEHVMEVLGLPWREPAEPPAANDDDAVFAKVEATVTTLDAIVAATRLPMDEVLQRLVELELDGRVEARAGGYVRCAR